jgi:hypothetical protein
MWNGRVMALKILDDNGSGLLSDAVEALQYAVAKNVRVSNNSWGYSEYLPEEEADHNALRDAIAAARSQGHLFVAAAGNDSVNTDTTPHYPSSFALDNIISVTATDNVDQLAGFELLRPSTGRAGDLSSALRLFGGSLTTMRLGGRRCRHPRAAALLSLRVATGLDVPAGPRPI